MASNQIRKHSIDFRKRQIRTTIQYHYTTTRMMKMKKIILSVGNDLEQLGLSNTTGKNINQYNRFRKPFGSITKLSICTNYDPAILFLGISPVEVCLYVLKKTCTRMFSASLFITPNWNNPNIHQQ